MPRTCLLLLLIPFMSSVAEAQAGGYCRIAVRLVSVTDAESEASPQMSSFLQDVSDQLSTLPFKGYETVDFKETRASFGQKATVRLRAAGTPSYSLSVVPHARAQGKVHLTVDWRRADKRNLLSTKLRILEGESVILGTDQTGGRPVLVAIQVSC